MSQDKKASGSETEGANTKNIGLRGIPVADTRISFVDGVEGKLIYRGYNITDLADNATFEEVVHLLLFHELPTSEQLRKLNADMGLLTAITIGFALLADFLFLPPLLMKVEK